MFDFLKPRTILKVVEIEKPKPSLKLTADMAESVISLQYHPGFLFLLDKLRAQKSLLVSTLVNERQAKLEDSEFLKSGIHWLDWLDQQISQATKLQKRQAETQPEPEMADAFQQIQEQLQLVGQ